MVHFVRYTLVILYSLLVFSMKPVLSVKSQAMSTQEFVIAEPGGMIVARDDWMQLQHNNKSKLGSLLITAK